MKTNKLKSKVRGRKMKSKKISGGPNVDIYIDPYRIEQSYERKHESELYREITKSMNKRGFHFVDISRRGPLDLSDFIHAISIEVKTGEDTADDGVSQGVYAIAQNEMWNMKYLAVADNSVMTIFKIPSKDIILDFARKLDPDMLKPPSSFSGTKYKKECMNVLGKPIWQGFWRLSGDNIKTIFSESDTLFMDEGNITYWHEICAKYGILVDDLISAFTDINYEHEMIINEDRIIVSKESGEPYIIEYNGPMKKMHMWMFKKLRINNGPELMRLRQSTDRLRPDKDRVERGAWYTEGELSKKMADDVYSITNPDFVIDNFAGAGSLIHPFLEKGVFKGWVNDYDKGAYSMLKEGFGKIGYTVTCEDILNLPIDEAVKIVGESKRPVIITNVPFGSSKGRKLKKIPYMGTRHLTYGKGNQLYQTMGFNIDLLKLLKRGYLAFFCQMGVFCERPAHKKFLHELLKNFTFIKGYVWRGKHFNDVGKDVPIAFTIWKYGGTTELEEMKFDCEGYGIMEIKRYPLLKHGWKYGGTTEKGEIRVGTNERFDCPSAGAFTTYPKGSVEVLPEHVKIPLNIKNVPSELAYALWCTVAGNRSLVTPPFFMRQANVHLPDFKMNEVKEILAYALLASIVTGEGTKIRYLTKDKIGYVGPNKVFKFGEAKDLNDGARYLLNTYGDLPVGKQNITQVLECYKRGERNKELRSLIVNEIKIRLKKIGYWDYIPAPLEEKNKNHFFEEWEDE